MNVMVESILLIQIVVMHRWVPFLELYEHRRKTLEVKFWSPEGVRQRNSTFWRVLLFLTHPRRSIIYQNQFSKRFFKRLFAFFSSLFLRCSRRHPLLFLVAPSVFLLLITLSGRHTSDRARLSLIHCHPIFFHDAYVAHSFFRCSWWESSQHTHTHPYSLFFAS